MNIPPSTPPKTGWEVKTLGEVLAVIKNGVNCKHNKDGKGLPISRIETIAQANIDFDRVGYAELNETEKAKYRLARGDILFSHINSVIHVGKTALVKSEDELYHGVNLLLMRCHDEVDSGYLNLFLNHIFAQGYWVRTCKQSVNQASVNQGDVKKVPIPVPPLPEQERIVGILDEAFEGIAAATAQAEKNLHNARELFQSVLQSTFSQKGDDWEETTLGEVCSKIGSGATPRGGKNAYKTEGISLIRSLNVYDREFRDAKLAFIDQAQADKLSNVVVEEGDVLLNITGASVARCCVAPAEHLPARVNQHVSIIRTPPRTSIPSFLNQLLTSKEYKDKLLGIGNKGGSTRQAITKAEIQVFKVALPPLPTQQSIVEKLDALSEETKALEAIYERKQSALAELKQSLLQKAFAGEL